MRPSKSIIVAILLTLLSFVQASAKEHDHQVQGVVFDSFSEDGLPALITLMTADSVVIDTMTAIPDDYPFRAYPRAADYRFTIQKVGRYIVKASYNGYFRRNFWASWDVNINLHYLIEVADQLEIYPLLGATFCHGQFKVDAKDSNDGDAYSHKYGKLGLNIGAGIQYSINEHLFVKGEAFWKYVPSRELDTYESYAAGTDTKFGQRAVISAGIGYRF